MEHTITEASYFLSSLVDVDKKAVKQKTLPW
jgi:hypothetical protein